MSKPDFCDDNTGVCERLKNVNEDICKGIDMQRPCEDYNPKMNFFEAWETADHAVTNGNRIIMKHQDFCSITILDLFKKEWTIIKKKKTVEVQIPEGAKNIKVYWGDDYTTTLDTTDKARKLTYEVDQ